MLVLAAAPALAQRGRGQGKPAQKRPQAAQPAQRGRLGAPPPGSGAANAQARPSQPGDALSPSGQQSDVRPGAGKVPGRNFLPGEPGAGPMANAFDRLRRMSPEEQEQFLRNHPRFQRLPPEQQQAFRDRLREWNALSAQEREERLRVEKTLGELTPQQRQRVRQVIFPRWQQLEPGRKMQIVRRLNSLRGLTHEERERRLDDAAFLQGLSEEEAEILRTFARLRLGPGSNRAPAAPDARPNDEPDDPGNSPF
jgi:hypothetical protein